MRSRDSQERDFYKILGVDKDASAAEIKKKYRSLARRLHPDITKGDTKLEEKFKAVSEAYETLSDINKRKEYDQNRLEHFSKSKKFSQSRYENYSNMQNSASVNDLFANIFGQKMADSNQSRDVNFQVRTSIKFRDAVLGRKINLNVSVDGDKYENISVQIPPGVQEGDIIRVQSADRQSSLAGKSIFVTLHVEPHPVFSRIGEDIHITFPVTFPEAALGSDIKVPTLNQDVTLRIPPGTKNGRVLRVKGLGVRSNGRNGDLMVTIEVQVPESTEGEALKVLNEYRSIIAEDDIRIKFRESAKQ